MGVLADFVLDASPAWYGRGHSTSKAPGSTWRWEGIFMANGVAVDLTSVVGECKLLTDVNGTELLELDVTGDAVGLLVVESLAVDNASLASSARVNAVWYLTLDDGDDILPVWLAANSTFALVEVGV